jgi:hypothetical protein
VKDDCEPSRRSEGAQAKPTEHRWHRYERVTADRFRSGELRIVGIRRPRKHAEDSAAASRDRSL